MWFYILGEFGDGDLKSKVLVAVFRCELGDRDRVRLEEESQLARGVLPDDASDPPVSVPMASGYGCGHPKSP